MRSDSGIIFGRYRLVEQLGSGGMARVFRSVVDGPRGFAHELVIKRIRPEYSRNAHFVNMLAAEARLCGLLRHPSIVQVHEFGEVNGDFYLAMELVEGYDLLAVARALARAEKRMPVGVACHIVHELAGALGYAHGLTDAHGRSLEVVHRDVSPSNIMIGALGTVKLLDFGIAKAAAHVREEQTTTGTLKGKIGYMSPEQAEGMPLDGRSDLFSLGVVLYEILTQRRLFRADGDLERLRLVREAKVAPPSSLMPGLDPALDAIVLKMLARTPAERYQRGEEVAAALTPFCSHAATLRQLSSELAPFIVIRQAAPAIDDPPMVSTSGGKLQPDAPTTQSNRHASPTGTGAGSRGELQPVPQLSLAASPWSMWRWVVPAAAGAALVLLGMWASGNWRRQALVQPLPTVPMLAPAADPTAMPTVVPTVVPAVAPTRAATVTPPAPSPKSTPPLVKVEPAPQKIEPTPPRVAPAPAARVELPAPRAVDVAPRALEAAPPRPRRPVAVVTVAPSPVESPPAPEHASASRHAAGAGARVRLRVAGPEHADVYVDGKLLGKVPLDVALDPQPAERHVMVRLPGFAPWSHKVAGNANATLSAHPHHGAAGAKPESTDKVYDPFAQ